MLLGLLPHQWYNLTSNSPVPSSYSYSSVRGELKMLEGNSFTVQNTFKGILPTIPYLANYSNGFDPSEMNAKIANIENDGLAEWTDSYNEGQVMNRLVQTARIADQTGNVEARDKMIATLKERLEDWLKYQSGEKAFLFYYNNNIGLLCWGILQVMDKIIILMITIFTGVILFMQLLLWSNLSQDGLLNGVR